MKKKAVKLQVDIAIYAVKARIANELRTWLLLRAIDNKHEGKVLLTILYEAEKGRRHRTSVDRILKRGEGLFWTIIVNKNGQKVIKLVGLENLFYAFYPEKEFVKRCVWAPLTIFDHSIANFRAAMYSLFFATTKDFAESGGINAPISRKVIHEIVGPCDRTQRRYDKRAGIQKSFNYSPHYALELTREQYEAHKTGEEIPLRSKAFFPGHVNGRYCQVEQLPNSYAKTITYAPCGKVNIIREELKSSRVSRNASSDAREIERHSLKNNKRYYFKAKTLAKRKTKPDQTKMVYSFDDSKKHYAHRFGKSICSKQHNFWSVHHPSYDEFLATKKGTKDV